MIAVARNNIPVGRGIGDAKKLDKGIEYGNIKQRKKF
jgi:hypothetical protein